MNIQSYQALRDGVVGYFKGKHAFEDRAEEKELRQAMLKRQIEKDKQDDEQRQFDRTMRNRQIELAERGDRREGHKMLDDQTRGAMDDVMREIEASRRGQETTARVKLLETQAAATAAKPPSPVAAQLAGVEDFAENFAAAIEENQAAMAEASQLGKTTPRVLKAQIRLSALQQLSESWKKNAEKEPTVDLEFPGEDGVSKMKMSVPQSQWNQSHPMWSKFGTTQPAAAGQPAGTGAGGPPPQAIQMLRSNPTLAAEFDKKYGAGQAQRILSGR